MKDWMEIFDVDTIKVCAAWVVGSGNWVLQIDTILHITVSLLSIVYIGLKIFEWYRKDK